MKTQLHFDIQAQPNDTTCGPTCLQAVYGYFNDHLPLEDVIEQAGRLADGGTLAVMLGIHGIRRGYKARIYTWNLDLFDPTWFGPDAPNLSERLKAQLAFKTSPRLHHATHLYLEFLATGGEIRFEEMNAALFRKFLKRKIPILTGLSATYLYQCSRELFPSDRAVADDLRGEPTGHFVVLCGYDAATRQVLVADPLASNPLSPDLRYHVDIDRLICSIMLGSITYDANLLILEPKERRTTEEAMHVRADRGQ
ncbi:MAG: hypothetical protein IT430_14285 [Phycisphaerales bacterium]|nr:hypothetical protein [Phycisphaerales bacterium]